MYSELKTQKAGNLSVLSRDWLTHIAALHSSNLHGTISQQEVLAWLDERVFDLWVTYLDDVAVAGTICQRDGSRYMIRDVVGGLSARQILNNVLYVIEDFCVKEKIGTIQFATLRRNLIAELQRDGYTPLVTLLVKEIADGHAR